MKIKNLDPAFANSSCNVRSISVPSSGAYVELCDHNPRRIALIVSPPLNGLAFAKCDGNSPDSSGRRYGFQLGGSPGGNTFQGSGNIGTANTLPVTTTTGNITGTATGGLDTYVIAEPVNLVSNTVMNDTSFTLNGGPAAGSATPGLPLDINLRQHGDMVRLPWHIAGDTSTTFTVLVVEVYADEEFIENQSEQPFAPGPRGAGQPPFPFPQLQ